jgi:hypothetical protein
MERSPATSPSPNTLTSTNAWNARPIITSLWEISKSRRSQLSKVKRERKLCQIRDKRVTKSKNKRLLGQKRMKMARKLRRMERELESIIKWRSSRYLTDARSAMGH